MESHTYGTNELMWERVTVSCTWWKCHSVRSAYEWESSPRDQPSNHTRLPREASSRHNILTPVRNKTKSMMMDSVFVERSVEARSGDLDLLPSRCRNCGSGQLAKRTSGWPSSHRVCPSLCSWASLSCVVSVHTTAAHDAFPNPKFAKTSNV